MGIISIINFLATNWAIYIRDVKVSVQPLHSTDKDQKISVAIQPWLDFREVHFPKFTRRSLYLDPVGLGEVCSLPPPGHRSGSV